MYQFITSQSAPLFYILFIGFTIIVFLFSYKISAFFLRIQSKKKIKKLEEDKGVFQKENKRLWDQERDEWKKKQENYENKLKKNEKKIENYRKKIAGLGILNFGGTKKRTDILYSLIMENEMLEQILHEQTEKIAKEQKVNIDQRLLDIQKRQRLLAEIFDDKKIKDYVKEVLEEKKITKGKLLEK